MLSAENCRLIGGARTQQLRKLTPARRSLGNPYRCWQPLVSKDCSVRYPFVLPILPAKKSCLLGQLDASTQKQRGSLLRNSRETTVRGGDKQGASGDPSFWACQSPVADILQNGWGLS